MTPEGHAAKVLQDYRRETGGVMADPLFVGRAIAAAIRAAVEAERDACATLAERLGARWVDTPMDAYNACLGVAGHIRARGETHE